MKQSGGAAPIALGSFVLAAASMAVVLSSAGGAPEPVPAGLPDPGMFVGWALPAARLLLDVALVAVVGFLLAATFLLPGRGDQVEGIAVDAARAAARASAVWCVAALALFVLTTSDTFARPLGTLGWSLLSQLATETSIGRALLLHAAVAAVGAVVLRWSLSVRWLVAWLGITLATLVPLTSAGHSASSGSHDLAGVSLALHVASASLWIGGLAALGWVALRGSKRFAPALTRYSVLAGWAFALVAVSGVVNGAVRLGSWSEVFSSAYGRVVVVKVVLLGGLGLFGLVQRRRLAAQQAGFGAVALLELLLMAAVVGLSVALARTPTPVGEILSTPAEEILGGPVPPAPGVARILWGFSGNGVGLLVVGLGTALYLRGWWTLRRRGDHWPVGRLLAWLVGMTVVAWSTFGGLGVYSHVLFSAHMVSHMMLSMVAPIFLVLAAPMTLALRTLPGPRQPGEKSPRSLLNGFLHSRFSQVLTFPLVPPLIFVGSLYGLYFTPLFGTMMDSHWGHAVMELHFLAAGTLFYYVVIGVDPQPRQVPPLARFGLLLLTLPFHAFFAIAVMSSNRVFASDYWELLDRPYSTDLLRDQYVGGSIAWALGEVPLLVVMIALFVQWIRSDQREARRLDRQADRDEDAALEAYNAHLRDLAEHGRRRDPDA